MEVEKVEGNHSADANGAVDKKSKKKVIIFASAFGVVVVGLIIAIIVILANRGNNNGNTGASQSETSAQDANMMSDEEATAIYDEVSNEIMQKSMADDSFSIDDVIAAYKEKMDAATDKKLKAMFASTYYLYLTLTDLEGEKKDEILKALIAADNIAQSIETASAVITAAEGYGDYDLVDKYTNILQDRVTELDARDAERIENGELEEDTEDESEDGGVGVYGATEAA